VLCTQTGFVKELEQLLILQEFYARP